MPAARAGWRFPALTVCLQDEKQVYATINCMQALDLLTCFFSRCPEHPLTQGMTPPWVCHLPRKNSIKCCGFGRKTLLMENLPGLCYKLSTPVSPGSASSGQSHLSDLQPSHNGNKQPMFCMIALHLRRTLQAPPISLILVLAKAPPHRCAWAGEGHSAP